ncbi:helix-turn-helix transcriptional regulator [Lactobacillus apis]|uniref:helix-turn-helix transcriptional regulator n=1 Tax=Lactobacillus apis TaxID=303541 RepID=UPI00242E5A40|nr:helix-turn-helix transcriptional regulator [Lactobacillus apis]
MKNRIKELREEKGLTLEKLGEKVDIAKNTLSRYESGKREPKLETWQKLADYFDVSVPYLQGFEMQTPNRLKELRQKKHLTLDDIETKTGIKRGTYSNYENGNTEPKLEVWQELAHFFSVSVPYLQGFDEYKSNRLKELRDKKGMSQSQFVQAFNELLISKKMKPITIPTYSRWENSLNSPTEKVWQQLADYFEVSVSYIKGEIDTEYLEKLIELAILFSFPEMILTYGNVELNDDRKSVIVVGILSLILNQLGYEPKVKFQEVYIKAINLAENRITRNQLIDFKAVVDKFMPKFQGMISNLLQAYEKL